MGVYFYGCITLDGYLADKSHNLDWLYQTGTTEETGYENFYQAMDITLMGKRTFSEIEKLGDAGEIYPTTQNYVFTHSRQLLVTPGPRNCIFAAAERMSPYQAIALKRVYASGRQRCGICKAVGQGEKYLGRRREHSAVPAS